MLTLPAQAMLSWSKDTLVTEGETLTSWGWDESPLPTLGVILQVVLIVLDEGVTQGLARRVWLQS